MYSWCQWSSQRCVYGSYYVCQDSRRSYASYRSCTLRWRTIRSWQYCGRVRCRAYRRPLKRSQWINTYFDGTATDSPKIHCSRSIINLCPLFVDIESTNGVRNDKTLRWALKTEMESKSPSLQLESVLLKTFGYSRQRPTRREAKWLRTKNQKMVLMMDPKLGRLKGVYRTRRA